MNDRQIKSADSFLIKWALWGLNLQELQEYLQKKHSITYAVNDLESIY